MKYLVTGINTPLGYDIIKELESKKENIIKVDDDFDITDEEKTMELILNEKPDVVFHCKEYSEVNKAELDEQEAYHINVEGTRSVMDAARSAGSKFFYISTDYIFDGANNKPYIETDFANPLNIYGRTKFLGEQESRKNKKSFIIRTSRLFGIKGNNFVKTMINISEKKDKIHVVDDQIGSYAYTKDLAKILVDIARTDKYGTYNITNEGSASWKEFAEEIFKQKNKNVEVIGIKTKEYLDIEPNQALRPLNSTLNNDKLKESGFKTLPTWQNALERYIKELEEQK